MKVTVYWRQKSTTPFLSKGQWITLLVGIICIITTITTASSQPKNKLEADSKTSHRIPPPEHTHMHRRIDGHWINNSNKTYCLL